MEQWTGSKLEKGYVKAVYILSPYLFNFYEEYIMQNARQDESQPEIKIVRKNINNLRYADDTSLMAESGKMAERTTKKPLEEGERGE